MQQTTNCTRKDSGIKKSWMFAIELCIELGSVERQSHLLSCVNSLLKQTSFMALTSVRQQQYIAWY